LLLLVLAGANAQSSDQDELVRRVTQAVLEALEKDARLERAIEQGIERYVERQRRTQAENRDRVANERARAVRPISPERDHVRGDPAAAISLIEYSDFECPYCKRFHETARAVVEAYDGRVNWVYRHFPLEFHNPHAQKQAEATECAAELDGNDGFWRYADAIYTRTRSNKGFPLAALVPLATELGLDEARFRECLDGARYAGRVQEDYDEGQRIGISGTPGTVLLHHGTGAAQVVSGAVPLERLRQVIDALLADAR